MSRPSILVIGSLNVDLITRTSRMPSAGETLHSTSYNTGCGGKGANQAVACARLSRSHKDADTSDASVRMTGAVGSDAFGQELIASLQSNHIDTSSVSVEQGANTGVAVIIVEESTGDNRILLAPNANFSLRPEQFTSPTSLHPNPALLVLQLEIPLDTTLAILSTARQQSIPVLLNPAPAQPLPFRTYASTTHLIVNETEAAIITSIFNTTHPGNTLEDCVKRLTKLPVPNIIITLGAQGVLYMHNPTSRIFILPAEPATVRDTTAAGDTFVGAYAVGIARGVDSPADIAQVIIWANKAAAMTVEKEGAQSAIPWAGEVEQARGGRETEGGDGAGRWWGLGGWLARGTEGT